MIMMKRADDLESAAVASAGRSIQIDEAVDGLIRTALIRRPDIHDCAVVLRTGLDGAICRVAYVVASGEVDEAALRDLVAHLPIEQQPYAYVSMSALPYTESGAINISKIASIPVLDSSTVRKWKERLRAAATPGPTAVQLEARIPREKSIRVDRASLRSTRPLLIDRVDGERNKVDAIAIGAVNGSEEGGRPAHLAELLLRAAAEHPDRGCHFIGQDNLTTEISYCELLARSQRVLGGLRDRGVQAGDAAIILCRDNSEFVAAFWGCVLAGVVPTPVSPPQTYDDDDASVVKLRSTVKLLENPLVITGDADTTRAHAALCNVDRATPRVTSVGTLLEAKPSTEWHRGQPDDPAIMMLTSGSTGLPKVVVQPQNNLIRQTQGSISALGLTAEDVSLNWFALDHVGSLVMFHLRDVMLGCKQVHAPTQMVIGDPLLWLGWIERHRVSISWAPNFAFGLVNRALTNNPSRTWDLSSLRCFINAGEAIVRQTAQAFLRSAMRFGAPASIMWPAWGMSETCSAVTYTILDPDAEAGDLGDAFVSVGRPIAGVWMRIVDGEDKLLQEGVIGRLQIRGDTTTPGYHLNPDANAESFTNDGWMITGDLGYISNGNITITGRTKDVVIVNGLNIHCHELEAVIEGVPGVSPSFAAAVPMRGRDSEELAVFIHSDLVADELRDLIGRVRQSLVGAFKLNPRFVLPIERERFPKTVIGKLQRGPLGEQLAAGSFASLIEATGQNSRDENSLPDWFFRRHWQSKALVGSAASTSAPSPVLIFADVDGLGSSLAFRLGADACVIVQPATEFVRVDAKRYQLDPTCAAHYNRLLSNLAVDGLVPGRIIHCWNYGRRHPESTDGGHLSSALALGFNSVVGLVNAMPADARAKLWLISSGAQPVSDDVAFERSPLLGLTGTINAEYPHIEYRHIDLPMTMDSGDSERVLAEVLTEHVDLEVAYRDGHRLLPALQRIVWDPTPGQLPFAKDGCYLITGGLGGIGTHVAAYLLREFQCNLLLVGRTPLDLVAKDDSAEQDEKRARLKELRSLGGKVCYRTVDISDPAALAAAVSDGEQELGRATEGVIHLAGVYASALLSDESTRVIDTIMQPKVHGSWALHQTFESRPEVFFVTASATVSLFRGTGMAAYSAANSFVESFSRAERRRRRVHCISWSLWDEVGMGRGLTTKSLMRRQGYMAMRPGQAMLSWELALTSDAPCVYVGLDADSYQIRRNLHDAATETREIVGYTVDEVAQTAAEGAVSDDFGTVVPCRFEVLAASSFDGEGRLKPGEMQNRHTKSRAGATPLETPTQVALAALWSRILEADVLASDDNFFELGGTSLLAAELLVAVDKTFKTRFTFASVVTEPTVAAMARKIDDSRAGFGVAATRHIVPLNTRGDLPPFFGMHPMFGLVYPYAELARQLAPEQPFYALQARGFARGERPHSTMEQLAADYIAAIREVQPIGPYYIGGWSLGSLIAVEVAQQLQLAGEQVACLAIIDQATDSMERFLDEVPIRTQLDRFGQVLRNAMRSYDSYYASHTGVLNALRRPLALLRFGRDVFVPMLKVAWASNRLARAYVIKPYAGKIVLLHTEDPELTHIEDARWGWDSVARDGVDVYNISGDHFNLHEQPHVLLLATQLRKALAERRAAIRNG